MGGATAGAKKAGDSGRGFPRTPWAATGAKSAGAESHGGDQEAGRRGENHTGAASHRGDWGKTAEAGAEKPGVGAALPGKAGRKATPGRKKHRAAGTVRSEKQGFPGQIAAKKAVTGGGSRGFGAKTAILGGAKHSACDGFALLRAYAHVHGCAFRAYRKLFSLVRFFVRCAPPVAPKIVPKIGLYFSGDRSDECVTPRGKPPKPRHERKKP